MKNILVKLLCLLGLVGCTSNAERGIFLYNTPEYNELVKTSNISLDDAKKIICSALYKKVLLHEDDKHFNKDKHFSFSKDSFLQHYLIYLDEYVFIELAPTHASTIYITSGIFVNRNTGELIQRPYNKSAKRIAIHNVRDSYVLKCK